MSSMPKTRSSTKVPVVLRVRAVPLATSWASRTSQTSQATQTTQTPKQHEDETSKVNMSEEPFEPFELPIIGPDDLIPTDSDTNASGVDGEVFRKALEAIKRKKKRKRTREVVPKKESDSKVRTRESARDDQKKE